MKEYGNGPQSNTVECDKMKGRKDCSIIVDKQDFIRILDDELILFNCKRRCELKECSTRELFINLFNE